MKKGWIRVEDKTPDDLVRVLMFLRREKTRLQPEVEYSMEVGTFREGKPWVVGNQFSWDMGTCTHWMPLPEEPEKGEV